MSSNEDIYNQPTEAFTGVNQISQMPTMGAIGQAAPVVPRKRKISGRALIGASIAGMAGAAIGGYALEQVAQKGGLSNVEHLIQHNGVSAIFHLNGPLATAPQIGHLLRRGGFGASPEELSAYQSLGFGGAVDRLINYQQASEDDTENRLKALNLNLVKPTDQQRWWLLRMAWTQRPLLEKMTLFWHGVLVSSYRKVGGARAYGRMMVQNQFFREHAFDTFDNILLGITTDPAMLFYLDLTKSTKKAPNENYARELMELFTLGLGHYTQQDVYEAAAALTGWHVKGLTSRYLPRDHNDLTKTFLGQTVFDPPNVAGWPGDKVSAVWLNSGTWMTRLNYIDLLLSRGTFTGRNRLSPIDLQGIVDANNIGSPEHFVDYFTSFLLDGVVDKERRAQYIDFFTTKDTSRGNAHITLKNGQSYPLNRVRGTLYLIMASPEYQLN